MPWIKKVRFASASNTRLLNIADLNETLEFTTNISAFSNATTWYEKRRKYEQKLQKTREAIPAVKRLSVKSLIRTPLCDSKVSIINCDPE